MEEKRYLRQNGIDGTQTRLMVYFNKHFLQNNSYRFIKSVALEMYSSRPFCFGEAGGPKRLGTEMIPTFSFWSEEDGWGGGGW